ncbi:pilus assembly PilX family protein [Ectopseudomonas alcaliphila]|uniref:pilus assembly PilX family protein n=1 Tax=Ectopseudomonas alcaliphila TaxID=101564 RepID=UPI002788BAD2|nr:MULTISPECIES: PilX N-terminal domain-containing pilus assembly protein [Pseudomonas]MDP9938051.1 type IV pilus assembly protein PilX [Pseudomonas sp. 3400]MDR7010274.1 type IV pilus assembly protein PilX [Pseudomonas alcaliphila]
MNNHRHYHLGQRQQGVSLLIALIFLLVITVLAIANMREVSLESRITGNMIEQKQLLNVAEASVRDGERRTVQRGPQEPTSTCENLLSGELCLLNRKPAYAIDATNKQVYSPDDKTELYGNATWYAQIAPGGELQGESENPEYGNMLLGIGIFRYEVTGMASSNGLNSAVRSTIALNSKGRIETE